MSDNAIKTLSLSEIDSVHSWMANLFRGFGIKGDELDHATAAAFSVAFRAIDQHRLAKAQEQDAKAERRANLRVVK